jgi:hypothetical protein
VEGAAGDSCHISLLIFHRLCPPRRLRVPLQRRLQSPNGDEFLRAGRSHTIDLAGDEGEGERGCGEYEFDGGD